MLHAESATTTSMLLKNTGNAGVQLSFDANLSAADASIGYIPYKWNGTAVAAIDCSTGADTMNKDDGYLIFKTATGGSLTQKMRLGYQLLIVELGNPATEDDAAKWDATYHEAVLRIGINGALTSSNITTDFNTQLLHNAYCTAAGSTDDGTFKYRLASAAAFVIDMSVADGFSFCAADPGSAGATITWRKFLDYTPGVVSHNSDMGDIDFKWYGDNRQVTQLDAGTDSFQFFDYNGVAAQWFATATPTNGFLRFNANKSLYFNTECQMFADGTYMYIQGNNLPDDAHKVTNYLYRDNGGYIKVA